MRRAFFLLTTLFFLGLTASAQKKKSFKVNPGEKVGDVIPESEMYTYPEFVAGGVFFRNQTYYPALLNYNALTVSIEFIDPKGDTLALDNEATIKEVVIKGDTFYYDKGYLKLVKNFGPVKLARREAIVLTNTQKVGGFGEATSASIESYTAMNSGTYFKQLVVREITTFTRRQELCISDPFNHFRPVNRKTMLDVFSKKEQQVNAYLKEHTVDFTREEDVLAMVASLLAQ